MNYPFWVFDWNRVKDYQEKYPLSKEIFKYPLSLWYGKRNAKPIKGLAKSLKRLFKRSGDNMPVLVIYNMLSFFLQSVQDIVHMNETCAE